MTRRLIAVGAASALALGALTGCTGSADQSRVRDSAADVVSSLGRVPVPTAPRTEPTATAGVARPAVLEMGAPVRITVGQDVAVLTALGPEEKTPGPGHDSTAALFTLQVHGVRGSWTVDAHDYSSRNETGHAVRLASVGARQVAVAPGRTGQLHLQGTYGSGAAQITYTHAGHVLAIWDFNVELD